jgi:hypothetical protein
MKNRTFRSVPKWSAIPAIAFLATLVACVPQTTDPRAVGPAPAVDLDEKPMISAHLEQADLAAGTVPFADLFAAGRTLFHTPFNGLDGVGVARLPNGTPIHRFALVPLGSTLLPPSAQS